MSPILSAKRNIQNQSRNIFTMMFSMVRLHINSLFVCAEYFTSNFSVLLYRYYELFGNFGGTNALIIIFTQQTTELTPRYVVQSLNDHFREQENTASYSAKPVAWCMRINSSAPTSPIEGILKAFSQQMASVILALQTVLLPILHN